MPQEDKDIQKTILDLKMQQEAVKSNNLKSKIDRYNRANEKVPNTVAQQDIDDLVYELKSSEMEKEIIRTQLEALED